MRSRSNSSRACSDGRSSEIQADVRRRRFQTSLTFEELSPVRPEKSLTVGLRGDRRPQQPGAADQPVHGRRPQAPLPDHRLPARQDGHAGEGRLDRVRPEPHGAHRAASLRRRREALHPRAERPGGRRAGRRRADGRHRRRQRAAAAGDPARHDDPQHRAEARQGRPDGPLRRRRARS